jgi:hypothetical protein
MSLLSVQLIERNLFNQIKRHRTSLLDVLQLTMGFINLYSFSIIFESIFKGAHLSSHQDQLPKAVNT